MSDQKNKTNQVKLFFQNSSVILAIIDAIIMFSLRYTAFVCLTLTLSEPFIGSLKDNCTETSDGWVYLCAKDNKTIPCTHRCDNVTDCQSGEDEQHCNACTIYGETCANDTSSSFSYSQECISIYNFCNVTYDCMLQVYANYAV